MDSILTLFATKKGIATLVYSRPYTITHVTFPLSSKMPLDKNPWTMIQQQLKKTVINTGEWKELMRKYYTIKVRKTSDDITQTIDTLLNGSSDASSSVAA